MVIENTPIRHEPTYCIDMQVLRPYHACSVHLLRFTMHKTIIIFLTVIYLSQFMTSTYLHVNCVVGVACAETFANTNIAGGLYVAGNLYEEDQWSAIIRFASVCTLVLIPLLGRLFTCITVEKLVMVTLGEERRRSNCYGVSCCQ